LKKLLSLILAIALLTGISLSVAAESKETTLFKAGTYSAKAFGNNDYIHVEVDVSDSEILRVEVVEHHETKYMADPAIEKIPAQVVAFQTINVDSVTGATVTSAAIRLAVRDALEQACNDISKIQKDIPELEKTNEEKTYDFDIVIIGAGGAGLSAAVSAAENGATNIVVLEKMPGIGGNTVRSGGLYNCADPVRQPRQNIEDSPEKHYEQTLAGGDNVGDPVLIRTMTYKGFDTLCWLENLGMNFLPEVSQATGALWPRSHQATEPAGIPFIDCLYDKAKANGTEFFIETKAESLIVKDGRVVGVEAVNATGDKLIFNAKQAVINAAGGYGANVEMRMQANPALDKRVPTTNHPGATGDGILMATAIGAATVGMDYVQVHPLATPGSGALNGRARRTGGVDSIIVVNKEGLRFVNEGERRDVLTAAILDQTDGVVYEINDAQIVGEVNQWGENVEIMIERGRVFKADTLEELAAMLGIDGAALVKTVETFNGYVDQKNDPEYGRTLWDLKIEKAPFYGVKRSPSVHHTMGGLKINANAQVLNTENAIIPGLFACGEVTGGIHGSNRLGGNAITDIMVFGRIAGQNAAKMFSVE
jgi:urocanate reductase